MTSWSPRFPRRSRGAASWSPRFLGRDTSPFPSRRPSCESLPRTLVCVRCRPRAGIEDCVTIGGQVDSCAFSYRRFSTISRFFDFLYIYIYLSIYIYTHTTHVYIIIIQIIITTFFFLIFSSFMYVYTCMYVCMCAREVRAGEGGEVRRTLGRTHSALTSEGERDRISSNVHRGSRGGGLRAGRGDRAGGEGQGGGVELSTTTSTMTTATVDGHLASAGSAEL